MPQTSFAVMTTTGRAKEAAALANATSITITHIAIGDGATVPSGGETVLYHEVARKTISGHGTVAGASNVAYFDCYLAAGDGPYTIREAGLIDAAGDLIAICHYDPPINKPTPASGQTVEGTVRLEVAFSDVANVVIVVDPSMQVALQRLTRLPWIPIIELARNAPPVSPVPGDVYVVGDTPTGAWAGHAGKVAEYTVAGWAIIAPPDGHGVGLPDGRIFIRIDGVYVGLAFMRDTVKLHGQCRLGLAGGDLILRPYNGNQIIIAGVPRTVPNAGVTFASAGLAASTTYFVYAWMDGEVMKLEASTTVRAQHTDGVWIKTGDPTRTLVGIARTDASTAWVNSVTQRFVRSFFNRKSERMWGRFTANRSTTAVTASPAELHSEIRTEFVCFSDDTAMCVSAGYFFNSTNTFSYSSIAFDGTATDTGTISAAYGTDGSVLSASRTEDELADGYHYATLIGYVFTGSTGTWGGGQSNTPTCAIHTILF